MITIETNRLFLREYQSNDWEAVHVYGQQEEILRYEAWGPNSKEETKAFVERGIELSKAIPRRTFELCVILKESNQLIGGCGFRVHENNTQRGDFGYIINPTYWNSGYATEAANGLLNFTIENYGILEIEATCDVLNLASKRVLEKCSLQLTKKITNHIPIKGRIRDTYCFERILILP